MSQAALALVNFGVPALTTVGYTLVNPDGSEQRARATAGVAERGTATGIYGAVVSVPDGFRGEIRWDTGGSVPAWASALLDDPLAARVPADYAIGTVGYIIGQVGQEAIVMSSQGVAPTVCVVYVGADYGPAPAGLPRLLWAVPAGQAPDATSGAFFFYVSGIPASPFTGTVITAGPTGDQLFEAPLTHAQTRLWVTGRYAFRAVLVTNGGAHILIGAGYVEVRPGD